MARPDPPRGASEADKESMARIVEQERSGRQAMAPVQPVQQALGTSADDRVGGSSTGAFGTSRSSAQAKAVTHELVSGSDADLDAALATQAPQLGLDLGGAERPVRKANPGLADKFVVPPFSVLDTRAGYWQERRRAWLSLGFRGETGPSAVAYNPGHSMVGGAVKPERLDATTTTEQPYRPDGSQRPPSGVYGGAGGAPAPLKAEEGLGRKAGMVYAADAPGGDPSFYDQKAEVEARLGRTLTTAEFQRDHYQGREGKGESQSVATGTSVFDPVLCETAYRWFSGVGAQVLDPFAGGVVRGALAAILGRKYTGVELRPEQIADNRQQAARLFEGEGALDFGREVTPPTWHEGDATKLHELDLPFADLVFTCPAYFDLERYSDDPRDLSAMSSYEEFRQALATVMADSTAMLRPNRFSVWVVGEARGKDGCEYGIVPDTINAARAVGLRLYNTAVLLNSVGSAALRAQRIIRHRKVTRVHQSVLVFVKGDPRKAAEACGSAEVDV